MLIVLEGCDGSGKSTLVDLLSQLSGCKPTVIHATRETPNDMDWFSEIIDRSVSENIIMDRAFWGQFVYQKPDERKLSYADLAQLENRLNEVGGKLFYVYSPERVIRHRLYKRSEVTSLPIRSILKKYKNLCIHARCPVIWYNTHTGVCKPFEHKRKES